MLGRTTSYTPRYTGLKSPARSVQHGLARAELQERKMDTFDGFFVFNGLFSFNRPVNNDQPLTPPIASLSFPAVEVARAWEHSIDVEDCNANANRHPPRQSLNSSTKSSNSRTDPDPKLQPATANCHGKLQPVILLHPPSLRLNQPSNGQIL